MRIFDNVLLSQYIDVGATLKVYVKDDWYTISDRSDLSDEVDAIGYDEYGGSHRFSYQSIKQIEVNDNIITLDMLSKKLDGEQGKEEGDKKPKKEPTTKEMEPDEEDKPSKKEPDLSWFSPVYDIGRNILREGDK